MGKTAHREHGELLTSYERVKTVYRGNSRLNKFVRTFSCGGIDRFAVYVHILFGDNRRAAVLRVAHTVENSSEHVFGNGKFLSFSDKNGFGRRNLQALRAFEKLNESFIFIYFENLAVTDFAVFLSYFDEFVILCAFDAFDEHYRSYDFLYGFIFLKHRFLLRAP